MENARDGGIHHAWNGTAGDSCVMRHARGGKENTAVQQARQQELHGLFAEQLILLTEQQQQA